MSNKLLNWTLFIVLCLIWGSSFKLMKDSSALTATQIAALRIFSASIVFLPFAVVHVRKIPKGKLLQVIVSALFGNLVPAFCFALALTRLDASLAGILNSLTPICVVVIGILFFRDHIKSQKIIGVLTGFAGLVFLTVYPALTGEKNISFDNLGYTLLILAATFSYGLNVNMIGHYLKGVNAIHIATVSLAFMSIPTALILWQQGFLDHNFKDPVLLHSIYSSIILGVAGSAVATAIFYLLVQRAGGLFASLVTYGIPFIALAWGFADGERITWVEVLCLGAILLGVYLANRKEN
jgi:drug/metabolite transporter (DMT)-like permease